ncbi:hypothetical protein L1987_54367 [Smallanthus sonchifolius]|uniref:Uncharacterized protein n=1 Tax=Smallanthus sonchifolius TaxID=185202 RepID=A0ACB9E7D0_9ASTR|nr:hypothetical protein L1987_54367 [Smallanthus sonchifolius]
METSFLVIFTFIFFQRFGTSSHTMLITSSNVTCIERERQSLLVFKQSLTDKYNLLSTWSGVECCEWHGVGCDSRNGHVVKLDLRTPGSFETFIFNDKRLELDNLGWVSSLSSLRYLDLSGITIGNHTDWFYPVNMLPSLLTLKLVGCDINIPSIKFVNLTSLNSLDLSSNNINSTIPIWLSNLTGLMHLNFNDNHFHGKIPGFLGMFSTIASIDLSSNSFETSISDVLRNLSSLVRLDLSWNLFSGPLPINLGLLLRLEYLYLQNNQLSGNIPMSLGLLSRLEGLELFYNQLSGNIPMSLGQLSNLKHLDLSYNSLAGVLSETLFTNLNNLNYLDLSLNSLALNFSSQWIAPFQLQIFFASSCNIEPHFPNWLQTQLNLRRLDISNSSIRDTIPEWFENILSHIDYLDLSNNQIGGKLPRFHDDSSNRRSLKMNSNKFEGSLATFPSHVVILDLSDNLLSGHAPKTDGTMNPNLEVVNLSKNHFNGSIPVHFCKVHSIWVLDLSQNNFSGRLPRCLGNLTNLEAMDVANNTITGPVPCSLGYLTQLRSLDLQNNIFDGSLPLSLQNLTGLVTMDLGNNYLVGSVPFWIGESLSSLKFLNLQSNKLTGMIPLHLCQLNALQYLSLAHNNITGMIPRCFGNLIAMIRISTSYANDKDYVENILASMKGRQLLYTKTIKFLTSIDLSNNNIVGEIPDILMNLVGLNNLNLSRNLITGQIPMMIGDLKQLESLDLSMNMLLGRIPQSLTSLTFLSSLNLSFNKLSGPIPVGNQIQTLDDMSIYKGNNGLCGPPISRSCKGNDVTYNHINEDEGQDDTEGLWFYAGMGLGFAVGLVGLLGSLHFMRRWRVAYFEMLEIVFRWLTLSILLNLARLRAWGQIPMMIGDLKQLESLDLSMNMLLGRIPQSLTRLTFLSSLNLSFNKLSGPIPVGNQIQTLDDMSIYKGNNGLCGPPISRSCKGNDVTYNHINEDEGQDDTEGLWFYAGMVLGFVVGLVGLLGSLHFMRRWRVAYFEMLEIVFGWLTLILLNLARLRRNVF